MRHQLCSLFAALSAAACETSPAPSRAIAPSATAAEAIERSALWLRHDTATVLSLSTEGATLDAAYDGFRLRRLDASFLGHTGRARDRFYFDSTLFYVTHEEARYDQPLSGRVIDSTVRHVDLRGAGVSARERDSLVTAARSLLAQILAR